MGLQEDSGPEPTRIPSLGQLLSVTHRETPLVGSQADHGRQVLLESVVQVGLRPITIRFRARIRPGSECAQGTSGRVRGAEGWRVAPCAGAGNILQPSFVWGTAEGGRGGVRVPPRRGNHHPLPVHRV